MDDREVLERLDHERRTLVRSGEVVDRLIDVTRVRAADGSHHSVLYSSLDASSADAAIAREIEHHRRLGVSFEWKAYAHDTPPDLLERLRRAGFDIGEQETVMVYDLSCDAAWINDAGAGEVRRVGRLEEVDTYRQLAQAMFGKDYSFTANELAADIRAGSTQHVGYIAYDGEQPVSLGRLYTHPDSHFGGLFGGATLASHRGRGFYRAVVAARARDARSAGARYLSVDALPTSRPILERLGFRAVTCTWPCEVAGV
jgi:hypothetical protein